jgi:hypothetical protein
MHSVTASGTETAAADRARVFTTATAFLRLSRRPCAGIRAAAMPFPFSKPRTFPPGDIASIRMRRNPSRTAPCAARR